MYKRSRDSSVSVVTRLPAGHRGIGVRFPARARLPFYQWVPKGGEGATPGVIRHLGMKLLSRLHLMPG